MKNASLLPGLQLKKETISVLDSKAGLFTADKQRTGTVITGTIVISTL
ncbi:hypothetical protein [Spirosoma koreense]